MSLFACVCGVLVLCGFGVVVLLFLGEGVCSPWGFAPLGVLCLLLGGGVCSFGSFLWVCVCMGGLFAPFGACGGGGVTTNNLAIAGNFFLFIEILEGFQVVCGTFWIELFLACHRTFGIFLIRARI